MDTKGKTLHTCQFGPAAPEWICEAISFRADASMTGEGRNLARVRPINSEPHLVSDLPIRLHDASLEVSRAASAFTSARLGIRSVPLAIASLIAGRRRPTAS